MKAFLMYRDRDFDLKQPLPEQAEALTQDLELNTLLRAMARDDEFLLEVAKKAVLSTLPDPETIRYRQDILKDCLNNPALVREIYAIAVEAIQKEKKNYFGWMSKYPGAILDRAINVLQMFVGLLKQLRAMADEQAERFQAEGFTVFFAMLKRELTDEYFASIEEHLKVLKFHDGVLMSAQLGKGNKGINYMLHRPEDKQENWFTRIFGKKAREYVFRISDRDENGARALSELRNRGINLVANALAQSTDHILSFFTLLRTELAFYVGCLNFYEELKLKGEPTSFPLPMPPGERVHAFHGLYDVCLALTLDKKVVGNDLDADDKDLVIITGANQGGKSTFLRSIGLSQLMMQCGMFVPAEYFRANVCERIFTHYKREEDTTMKSGKFDEELKRMSEIVDHIRANSLILFNESFAATNEREGSEIAKQITDALLEKSIKVFFVTHMYEYAHGFYKRNMANAIFLRAERSADGGRTFKIREGEPLDTSYGADLYTRIFNAENTYNEAMEPRGE